MPTDLEIAQALKEFLAGDESAADRLSALLHPDMLVVAGSLIGDGVPGPEDVVQDSLLAVLRYLKRRPDFRGRVSAFAATVVKNRCLDVLRQKARTTQYPIEEFQVTLQDDFMHPMDMIIREEVHHGLGEALERLDPPCKDLLVKVFFEGRSLEELKGPLGLSSVQALYYRKKKCLEKLRNLFKTRGLGS
ncbi:MAG: sigma-70 family RNA polymerase sigma factor [bacterium]|nr:sigma-70 family RNA polymerase sigma factor [bacterium]